MTWRARGRRVSASAVRFLGGAACGERGVAEAALGDARSSWRSARAAAPPPRGRSQPPCCSVRGVGGARASALCRARSACATVANARPKQRRREPGLRRRGTAVGAHQTRCAEALARRERAQARGQVGRRALRLGLVSCSTRLRAQKTTRGTASTTACPGRLRRARRARVSAARAAARSEKQKARGVARAPLRIPMAPTPARALALARRRRCAAGREGSARG